MAEVPLRYLRIIMLWLWQFHLLLLPQVIVHQQQKEEQDIQCNPRVGTIKASRCEKTGTRFIYNELQ